MFLLQRQSRLRSEHSLNTKDWMFVKNIPLQLNGYDCGVFSMVYAEFASRRAKVVFDQGHMGYFRDRIVTQIISGNLSAF